MRSVILTVGDEDSPPEVGRIVTHDRRIFAYHFGKDINALRLGRIVERDISIREITGEGSGADEMREFEVATKVLDHGTED
jgi:hypothetical protein